MSGKDILDYIVDSETKQVLSGQQQQFHAYIDKQIVGKVEGDFINHCNENAITGDYVVEFQNYINNSDYIANVINSKFKNISGEENIKTVKDLLEGYVLYVDLPDGSTYDYKLHVEITGENPTTDDAVDEGNKSSKTDYISGELILKKSYETDEAAAKALINSSSYDSLLKFLNSSNFEEDPSTWFTAGGEGYEYSTALGQVITDAVHSGEYKQIYAALTTVKNNIMTSVGEDNYTKIMNYYTTYEKMSDRDKALLSDSDKANYAKLENFVVKMRSLEGSIETASQRDSNIWSEPWEYVGDSWKKAGNTWKEADSLWGVVKGLGETANATAKTLGSGAIGVFKFIFGL